MGSYSPQQQLGAPGDLGVLARRVCWGTHGYLGRREGALGMPKHWETNAGSEQWHQGEQQGLGEFHQGDPPECDPESAITMRGDSTSQGDGDSKGTVPACLGQFGKAYSADDPTMEQQMVWGECYVSRARCWSEAVCLGRG